MAFWLLLQFAIVMHVEHVAQAAAQDAASEAAAGGDGAGTAGQMMTAAGAWTTGYDVAINGASDHVTVVVTADVIRVFPLGSFSVEASGAAPIEEFIPQPERP